MKLNEILEKSGLATQYKIFGEQEFDILERVTYQGSAKTCIPIDQEKYFNNIPINTTMILTTIELYEKYRTLNVGICVVEHPWELFFLLHNWLFRNDELYHRKIYKTKIGKNCKISSLAYISESNVTVGDNVIIEEFVSIKPNTSIGNNSTIMSGCVLGGNGLEYKKMGGEYMYVEHAGGTVIEENVTLHSNVVVNKSVFPTENTHVGRGTKVDSFTMIAHGVQIGEHNLITTSCAIAGRTQIGNNVFLSPGALVSHNLSIGDECIVNVGAVVTKDLSANSIVSGNFAVEHKKFIKHIKEISQ